MSASSLRREQKRKFNRNLCGTLLGISIVLVILGILGIIGIAVYLGVLQKVDGDNPEELSIDGVMRVLSDEFTIALLNPDLDSYRLKSRKYSSLISRTFEKSLIRTAFLRTSIDGFSHGSLKVFFKIFLDKHQLPESIRDNPVPAVQDIFVQEIMALSGSEFDNESIDMDSVAFALSQSQTEAYFKPQPYLQQDVADQETAVNDVNVDVDVQQESDSSSLWQSLMARNGAKPANSTPIHGASERMDVMAEDPNNSESFAENQNQFSAFQSPSVSKANDRYIIHSNELAGSPVLPKTLHQTSHQVDSSVGGSPMSPFLHPPPPRSLTGGDSNGFAATTGNGYGIGGRTRPVDPPVVDAPSPPLYANNPVPLSKSVTLPRREVPNRRSGPTEVRLIKVDATKPKYTTAQQIIRQQMLNTKVANKMAANDNTFDRMLSQPSSEQFWTTIDNKNRGMTIGGVADAKPTPKLKFNPSPDASFSEDLPPSLPLANQFMVADNAGSANGNGRHSIKVFNLGASGHSVVDAPIPPNRSTNNFNVGSSAVVEEDMRSSPTAGAIATSIKVVDLHPEVGVYPAGEDSNILHPMQVPAGTLLRQGPHGPIIPTARTVSFPIRQTPNPPQMFRANNQLASRPLRNEVGGADRPGPGRYRPPVRTAPKGLPGPPGSGQQLVKHYLKRKTNSKRVFSQPPVVDLRRGDPAPKVNRQGDMKASPAKVNGFAVRQDLASAAIPAAAALGAISSSLTPVSIFTNLLNAYATFDSKHNITDQLVQTASSWMGSNNVEPRASTATTTAETTTRATTSTTTLEVSTKRTESDFRGIFVNADGLPPVRSNVNPEKPLRPKPPSEVTPAPNHHHSDFNPHYYYAETLTPVKENKYRPEDFVVETVKLDKAFFHQFFTSKPLLLDGDVDNNLAKRGRQTDFQLPTRSLANSLTDKLQVLNHDEERKGSTTDATTTSTTTTTTTETYKLVNNVKTFRRYHIPTEVKISHGYMLPEHVS